MASLLIVDDEAPIRFALRSFLEDRGFAVLEADTLESAERTVREARPDAVILDYVLPDGNALDVLPRLKDFDPTLPVIVLTGHASVDLAVRAVKEGADHFLAKPVDLPALHVVLMRALEQERDRRKKAAVRPRQGHEAPNPFLGTSPRPGLGRAGTARHREPSPHRHPGRDRHGQGCARPLVASQRAAGRRSVRRDQLRESLERVPRE